MSRFPVSAPVITSGIWTVQQARAEFRARNFGWHIVSGTIGVVSGVVDVGTDQTSVSMHASLDPASIDTGNGRRDKDLRGRRFLDVAAHPTMTVDADLVSETAKGWQCEAVVRVAGAVAPVTLDVTLDAAPTAYTLRVRAVGRLDLRAVGIRVPPFMVRRHVDLTVTAILTDIGRTG